MIRHRNRNRTRSSGVYCHKVGYSKKSHADDQIKRKHESDPTITSYKCPRCGKFHVGHDKFAEVED